MKFRAGRTSATAKPSAKSTKIRSAKSAAKKPVAKRRKRIVTRRPRLTPTHKAILNFIIDYKADPQHDGNSPSYDEIAEKLGIHRATVYRHCQKLEERGWLQINAQGKLILPGGRWRYTPHRT
ncbi:MAG: helix-turn-helix domain-containing protein [Anaerolineae bacterium]